jgi:hypothetical protein
MDELRRDREYVVGAMPPGFPKPCQPGTGVPQRPDCYRNGCRLCDLTKCANSITIPATSAVTLQVQPASSRYFEPIAVENACFLSTDPTQNRRARIGSVAIGGSPQENFDDRNPVLASTVWVLSDAFLPSGFGPVPVPWGMFSRTTDSKPLEVFLFNPHADAVIYNLIVYGNAYDDIPRTPAGNPPPLGTPWGAGGWGGKGPVFCGGGNGNGGGGGGNGGPLT